MTSLKDHFLIAMPSLGDADFSRSVTLICEHSDQGAMGIKINHPLDITHSEVFAHLKIAGESPVGDKPVMLGGPVSPEKGFVIHRRDKPWQNSLELGNGIAVTTSEDILESMASAGDPGEAFIALGYAGWEPNQLETELAENSWLTCPADPDIIFSTPIHERWEKAGLLIGIDISGLTDQVGHS